MLVALLDEPQAVGKTFEMLTVAGYPKPSGGYAGILAPLWRDCERGPLGGLRRAARRLREGSAAGDEAAYGLLQQLLPGEAQQSAGLAMGQTYEQYDRGVEGRLGPRGQEQAPSSLAG